MGRAKRGTEKMEEEEVPVCRAGSLRGCGAEERNGVCGGVCVCVGGVG